MNELLKLFLNEQGDVDTSKVLFYMVPANVLEDLKSKKMTDDEIAWIFLSAINLPTDFIVKHFTKFRLEPILINHKIEDSVLIDNMKYIIECILEDSSLIETIRTTQQHSEEFLKLFFEELTILKIALENQGNVEAAHGLHHILDEMALKLPIKYVEEHLDSVCLREILLEHPEVDLEFVKRNLDKISLFDLLFAHEEDVADVPADKLFYIEQLFRMVLNKDCDKEGDTCDIAE